MRLIDADAGVDVLQRMAQNYRRIGLGEVGDEHEAIARMLSKQECFPTIDAAPVVRCKDCKHRNSPYNCPMRKLVMPVEGPGAYEDCTEDDGYCHKGDRKEVPHD